MIETTSSGCIESISEWSVRNMVWQPVITEVEHLSNEETDVIATELGAPKKR